MAFATSTPATVEVPPLPVLTIQERAVLIAEKHGIATTTFANLIQEESKWNEKIPDSPQGDRGLLQINRKWHSEVSDECAYDADCAMNWAAEYIAKNGWDEWTPCNCYSYAKVISGSKDFPLANELKPNGPPQIGSIVIMDFNGVIHYEVLTRFTDDGSGFGYKGANRKPCDIEEGVDSFGDSRIVGFHNLVK